jgi:UDP-2-acetamido-3-amino-2,3-dideoxy-glucuronate N-acetyltransferase
LGWSRDLKEVPDYALVWKSCPTDGWMSEFGHKLQFDAENIAVCEERRNTN